MVMKSMMIVRRSWLVFGVVALIAAWWIVRLIEAPGYTDVFYHYNAAVRVANGQGFTEPYLWTYIGAPDRLPESGVFPSHLYWMPLTSLSAAVGLALFGGDYAAAQIPFTLMLVGTGLIGFWLGNRIGGSLRHAWMAGLITLFSGFYTRFWGTIDTFAPFALAGSACLVMMGLLRNQPPPPIPLPAGREGAKDAPISNERERVGRAKPLQAALIGGMLAGIAHLTRADGLLFVIVGVMVVLWGVRPHSPTSSPPAERGRNALLLIVALIGGYGVVMLPWAVRNIAEINAPLPLGGTQAAWFRSYDDLFDYPPVNTPETLFADGVGGFIDSRWVALTNNLGTFIAVEGMIVLAPLMLIGLWVRRRDPFLTPFWLYALGLHMAFTLVFPFPGYRGGLLHSAAALVPFWAALGAAGLDDVIGWIASRRRRWRAATARLIFSAALVAYAVGLSVWIGSRGRVIATDQVPELYRTISEVMPDDARVLINDPAMLYTFTGLGGAVIPNESPDVIPEIADRYAITHVVIEPAGLPAPMQTVLTNPPTFLREIARAGEVIVYEIDN